MHPVVMCLTLARPPVLTGASGELPSSLGALSELVFLNLEKNELRSKWRHAQATQNNS